MADISRITEIPPSTLANWKRRDTYPTADNAERIASALGVPVTWLVTGQDMFIAKPKSTPKAKRMDRIIARLRTLDQNQLEALEPVIEYLIGPESDKRT